MDTRDDEILLEWFASSPSTLDRVLTLTSIQTQLGITKPIVFMATLCHNFEPFQKSAATSKEQERFEQMQLWYAAAGGSIAPEQLLHLSPRMVAEEDVRKKLKNLCLEYLEQRARSAEAELLQDEEVREQEEKRAKKLKEKRRKKKQKKKCAGANVQEQEKQQSDGESSTETSTLTSSKQEKEVVVSPIVAAAASESIGSDKENDHDDSVAKGKTTYKEETGPTSSFASPPSQQVAQAGESSTATKPSVPPPPPGMSKDNNNNDVRISYLQAASKPIILSAQTIGEELLSEKVQTLEHQVHKQRRDHLESQQQVKLKAFIAETQAEAAVERSENLERLLVEAICQIVMEKVIDAELKKGVSLLAGDKPADYKQR